MKICSLYGDGFYYIPGTDTCLKMGGYLRVQAEYNMGGGGVVVGDSAGGELSQGRFTRDLTNDINYRVRGAISWDVRQQTEYGTLRTYIRFGAENTTPTATGGGTTFNPFWDRAFIQFAGFTVGRSQSFFDLFTYGGAYSYHNVRVSGDTGASGQNLWAYTAQFGNGFSGTLSLEDPATRKGGTVDLAAVGFAFSGRGALVTDNAFAINNGAANAFGFRVPDIIANLRLDQAWGFVGISAALHDASGAYYGANAATNVPPFGGVGNGHPEDKYGWALAGGAKFNLTGGDMIGFNVCYAEGAPGFCTNNSCFTLYNSNTSVGVGWIADGVFATGTQIELTRVWSALAGYEHIWNPKWRTSVFGGYVNVNYGSDCHRPDPAAPAGRVGGMRRRRRSRPLNARSSPSRATAAAPTTTSGKPAPAPSGTRCRSSMSASKCCTPSAIPPSKAPPSCPPGLAAPGPRPRRPGRMVRNVPLAAQLLSMIA